MVFQISIVIYNLIGEICTEFLCNKHNYMPACGGHAVSEGLGCAKQAAAPPGFAARRKIFPIISTLLLQSCAKLL